MGYNIENFTEEFANVPGLEEFFGLLAMPDASFDILYPSVREALVEQLSDPATATMIKEAKSTPEFAEISNKVPEIMDKIRLIPDISENKIDFLSIIFGVFTGEVYDAAIDVEIIADTKLPTYAHLTDAGADIYAAEDITIPTGSFGFLIPTGLKVAIPSGWLLSVRPRSGMSKKTKLRVSNTPGTVDSGYRDEIGILIDNFGENITISKGDRIAQFILEKSYRAKWRIVNSVSEIGENRGGGFGSSGK